MSEISGDKMERFRGTELKHVWIYENVEHSLRYTLKLKLFRLWNCKSIC